MFDNSSNLNQDPEDIFSQTEKSGDQNLGPSSTSSKQALDQVRPKRLSNFRPIKLLIILVILIALVAMGYFGYTKLWPYLKGKLAQRQQDQINQQVVQNQDENNQTATDLAVLDSDKDGLTDQEEVISKTDPNMADTDGDGLFDGEEVKVYKTNPLNPDTDGDGTSDGVEVKRGDDPNNPNPGAKLFDLQKAINNL